MAELICRAYYAPDRDSEKLIHDVLRRTTWLWNIMVKQLSDVTLDYCNFKEGEDGYISDLEFSTIFIAIRDILKDPAEVAKTTGVFDTKTKSELNLIRELSDSAFEGRMSDMLRCYVTARRRITSGLKEGEKSNIPTLKRKSSSKSVRYGSDDIRFDEKGITVMTGIGDLFVPNSNLPNIDVTSDIAVSISPKRPKMDIRKQLGLPEDRRIFTISVFRR